VTPLGPEGFAAQTGVSRETVARLEGYAELLKRWSGRINLVSRNTLGDLWRRHFLDSAQLLPLIPQKARSLVDLGSGAGFPGLVLAILGVSGVELIESDKRKGVFLREAARLTNTPVKITDSRIEMAKPHAADVVTARACAPLGKNSSDGERCTPRPDALPAHAPLDRSSSDGRLCHCLVERRSASTTATEHSE